MFFYWACDNVQILSQLKIITGNADRWGQLGMTGWSISLVCNLIQFIRQLKQNSEQLSYYADIVAKNPEKKESFKDDIKKAKVKNVELILNLIKTVGDILPAFKGASKMISLRNH